MTPFQQAVQRVGQAAVQARDLDSVLTAVAEGAVDHLDATLARVWLVGPADSCATCALSTECGQKDVCLHLMVSRGLTTNLDGEHRRVPLGARKIGRIAERREPHLSADVLNDPRVPNKAWVESNGLKSFAGYPLVFSGTLQGVVGLFSKAELDTESLESVGLLAGQASVAVENARLNESVAEHQKVIETALSGVDAAVLVLTPSGCIRFANPAAQKLFGGPLIGEKSATALRTRPELSHAIGAGQSSHLNDRIGPSYLVSTTQVVLDQALHCVVSIRDVSRATAQHELQVWRRALRVVNHELRNSISPISSLASTGAQLVNRPDAESKLGRIFEVISERSQHLKHFLDSYSRFARLAKPRIVSVEWPSLLAQLREVSAFDLEIEPGAEQGACDPTQIEQVLINLVKNAHEAQGDGAKVTVKVSRDEDGSLIRVQDSGPGLDETMLTRAFLPDITTKESGTGLGLALCRDVVDAHGGSIALANRDCGGLEVQVWLPGRQDKAAAL